VYEIWKTRILIIFWKDTKIPKDIEKNIKICFSFNNLGSIKTFWNITIVKCLFLKIFSLKLTSNKFAIWNYLFALPTTIAHPTWISFDEIIITGIKKRKLKKCLKKKTKKNTKYKNIERCKIDNKKQIQI